MMKIIPFVLAVAALSIPQFSLANNVIRVNAPITQSRAVDSWISAEPMVGSWVTSKSSGCVDSPARYELNATTTVQYQSCDAVTKTRTVQQREYNAMRGEYRNVGEAVNESETRSTLNEPRNLDCRYNQSSPVSKWSVTGAGNRLPSSVTFNNAGLRGTLTEFQLVSDGVTYLRGSSQAARGGSSEAYTYYYICKVLD
ncbi:hypothetical protein ACOK4R_32205 (plasmid) [Pseudomonas fluorescens]|uniref:hypothetical protein n=1 Tax=Pseudomonas fluorescens TaxID=294 RepID=UPI001FD0CF45|nr:hypothetical protein [Pseudomonas fluorescens]